MQKLRRRLAGPLLITGVLIALSAGGLALGVFGGFQRATTDRLFPAATADARIAVVGIDGRSISDLGERWPWPRELQAKLIRAIAAERPRLIVYDVVVGAPSAGDDQLSAALHEAGNVVLAAAADVSATSHGRFFEARTIAGPTTSVASAAVGIGLTNITADPGDGVVRSLPLVIESPSGNLLPSIALEAAVRTTGQPDTPTIRPDGVQVGSVLMPTESRASLTINFAEPLDVGAPAAPYSSAADVLRGSLPGRRLAGKVVLVGVVDPTLGDVHLTPVNKSGGMPGVFVLANGVNTILTRAYVHRSSRLETIASIAMLAFAVALLTRLLPVWLSPAPLIAAGAGYLVFAFLRFDAGYVMDLVYPELSVAGAFVGGLGARAYGEVRKRRRIASLFGQYVPATVARQLIDEEGLVQASLRGERAEVTVFFCDLRGFTSLAGSLPAATVRDMLEVYYRHGAAIVLDHGGTLLQYVGDEIFAVFGTPIPQADHSARALACARAMQDAVAGINAELMAMGVEGIGYGIGIQSGEVVAGHVGNEIRRHYAVVGDTVNVGARLCAKAAAGEIVLSEDVLRRLDPAPEVEDLGAVALKGVERDLKIYRVGPAPASADSDR